MVLCGWKGSIIIHKNRDQNSMLQWCAIEMQQLLHKPYVNEVTLNEQNLCLKYRWSFELNLCMLRRFRSFQRGTVGQLAAKLQAVKVGEW